jgi:hypothetical protein
MWHLDCTAAWEGRCMRTKPIAAMCLAIFVMVATSAGAVSIPLAASLDCAQEVPSTCGLTSATGAASLTFDTDTSLLSWSISWSGLSGAATGMHFHGPALPGANAGVQVNVGAISGLASPSIGSATLSATQESQLLSGQWYLNVHSALSPGGEIRGQVNVIPEPGTLALVALGVVAIALQRRRPR